MAEAPKKPRRLWLRWLIGLSTGLILIVGIWLTVVYVSYNSARTFCRNHIRAMTTEFGSRPKAYWVGMGGRYAPFEAVPWMEGGDWTDPNTAHGDGTYDTAITDDNIRKSRLVFWRLIADPELATIGVSPGGPHAFICPARRNDAESAMMKIRGVEQRDFPEPRKNLFYSMFNHFAICINKD